MTGGANLIITGTRLGDRGSSDGSHRARYSLNLTEIGGSFRNMGTPSFTNGSANITLTNHGLSEGCLVLLTNSGGALPTNFTSGGYYFVITTGLTGSVFQLSSTRGGTAITAGSAGSGTHTAQELQPSCYVTACNMGTIRLGYTNYNSWPWKSVEVHSSNCVIS